MLPRLPDTIHKNKKTKKLTKMKMICHQTTRPTAEKLADILGIDLLVLDGPVQSILSELKEHGGTSVNWGIRLRLPDTWRRRNSAESGKNIAVMLNAAATIPKPEALSLMQSAGVPVPRFLSGYLMVRPAMTRKGRSIHSISDGVVMEVINKDLEFRVDVFLGKAFRLHIKTGPEDQIAWNRDGADWVTFGTKTMVRGARDRFGVTEEKTREVIQLAKDAVSAIGYDFGAVDIIREKDTGKLYALEVNSAPSLDENGLRKYAERIKRAFATTATTSEAE